MRPAQTLERLGFRRGAEYLRRLQWAVEYRPPLSEVPWLFRSVGAWLLEPIGRRSYRVLTEDELRATRRSDTVFLFGSGRSLVDVDDAAWGRIERHDTAGFSNFHRQRWVRVDYHLIAEVVDIDAAVHSFRTSPHYRDTIYLVNRGPLAHAGSTLVGRRLLPRGARIFRWRRAARGRTVPASTSFAAGLVHGSNTILDLVNFALLMGWRRIVIAGVDLYDRQYFWLPEGQPRPDERPELTVSSRWIQADHVIEMLGSWREVAAERGVEVYVYDGRSLLGEALPVFSWSDADTYDLPRS